MEMKPQTTPEAEVTITRNAEGYTTVDLELSGKSICIEIGKTKYSGYLKDSKAQPILFEGMIDNV